MLLFQAENGAQVIFLKLFTVCSSCKWKFFVCPFVYEETKGRYLFANGLNTLNRLERLYRMLYGIAQNSVELCEISCPE